MKIPFLVPEIFEFKNCHFLADFKNLVSLNSDFFYWHFSSIPIIKVYWSYTMHTYLYILKYHWTYKLKSMKSVFPGTILQLVEFRGKFLAIKVEIVCRNKFWLHLFLSWSWNRVLKRVSVPSSIHPKWSFLTQIQHVKGRNLILRVL